MFFPVSHAAPVTGVGKIRSWGSRSNIARSGAACGHARVELEMFQGAVQLQATPAPVGFSATFPFANH